MMQLFYGRFGVSSHKETLWQHFPNIPNMMAWVWQN